MENKLTNIKERILHLVEQKGDAKEKFFEKVGMTYGSFKGKAKTTPLNSDAIANILAIYNDVSPEWLVTGHGSMLKGQSAAAPVLAPVATIINEATCPLCAEKDKRIAQLEDSIEHYQKEIDFLRNLVDCPPEAIKTKRRSA